MVNGCVIYYNRNMIRLTKHAEGKFATLAKHGLHITHKQVLETVIAPEKLDYSRLPLLVAQRKIDRTHVLRVVYKVEAGITKIITFYPGRIKQYE